MRFKGQEVSVEEGCGERFEGVNIGLLRGGGRV